MATRFRCPHCSTVFPATEGRCKCPGCGLVGRIPDPVPAPKPVRTPRPARVPAPRRERILVAVVFVALLLVAGLTAALVLDRQEPTADLASGLDGASGSGGPGASGSGGLLPGTDDGSSDGLGNVTPFQPGAPVGGTGPVGTAPEAITFEGGGDNVTRTFQTVQGLLRVRMDYYGDGYFRVRFVNQDDPSAATRALTAPAEGEYHGSRFIGLPAGRYVMDVDSGDSGSGWAVSIVQPRAEDAAATPETWSGAGDFAPGYGIVLDAGNHTFEAGHAAALGEFVVRLYDANGNLVRRGGSEAVFSAYGDFSGAVDVDVPADGVYYLDVQAAGDWSVRVL